MSRLDYCLSQRPTGSCRKFLTLRLAGRILFLAAIFGIQRFSLWNRSQFFWGSCHALWLDHAMKHILSRLDSVKCHIRHQNMLLNDWWVLSFQLILKQIYCVNMSKCSEVCTERVFGVARRWMMYSRHRHLGQTSHCHTSLHCQCQRACYLCKMCHNLKTKILKTLWLHWLLMSVRQLFAGGL